MNRKIIAFAALSFTLGALVDLTFQWLAPPRDAAAYLLWGFLRAYTPTMAAMISGGLKIVRHYVRIDKRVMKYYLLSPLIVYPTLTLYILFAAPLGIVDLGRLSTLLPFEMDPIFLALLVLLNTYVAAITINAVYILGEEIGWRGFLQDALEAGGVRPVRAALFAGAIWGIWHAPATLILGFNYPDNRLLGAIIFVPVTVSMSLPHWISRAVSSSVLPAASLHGSINAAWGISLVVSTVPREIGGLGALAIASWAVTSAALYLWFRRGYGLLRGSCLRPQ